MKSRSIRNLLLASIGAMALSAATAHAADITTRPLPLPKAPAVFVPFFTWTGFYVGINAGYAFGDTNWTNTNTGVTTGNFNTDGWLVGGTLGYNMQFGSAVFGVEGDIDWSNVQGSTTTACPLGCTTKNTWFGTARGRIGYAFDRFMPYFTAGAAFGDVRAEAAGFSGTTKTQFSWVVGGGVEYAFMNNWSAKFEYLYTDLDTVQCPTAACGTNIDTTLKMNIVRGGLNYKF